MARCPGLARAELQGIDHRGLLDPSAAEEAVQVVLVRLLRSRSATLLALGINRGGPGLPARCAGAAVRGAGRAEVERELGRPLSEAEAAAMRPLADDPAAERYLRRALRHALIDVQRKQIRLERAHREADLEPEE
jgi:hypothetical protein